MTIIYLILCWFSGIWLAGTTWGTVMPQWGWVATAGLMLGLAVFFWRSYRYYAPQAALLAACLTSVALGGARWIYAQPQIDSDHIAYYNDSPEVILYGRTISEPDIRDRSINLRFAVEQIELKDGSRHAVSGDILIQTPRFPVIPYGTELTVTGDLLTPPSATEFSYRDYLANQGIYSYMRWPLVRSQTAGQGSPLYHTIYATKNSAQQTIQQLIPEPAAGLLSGILLGIGHATPPDLDNDFRTVGITHIVVISGFNISLIAAIFLSLFTPLLGRKTAAYGTICAIILYTIMVGADASVVRAAIMGSIYVLADRLLGRANAPIAPLFVAAAIMTIHDPHALWNVGFQLSFAATLSLMLYADPLTKRTQTWLRHWFDRPALQLIMGIITEAALITIAAQILTLPLLMAYFQQLSLISLLANFFVLPAQPAVMIFGGIATMLGMIWLPIAYPFAWIATLFLQYTIRTAAVFAQIPYAIIDVSYSFGAMFLTYLVIGVSTWYSYLEPEQQATVHHHVRQKLGYRLALSASLLLFMLTGQWVTTQPDGTLQVTFFDVGQGDAIFIQTPTGRQILIDGGYYPTILNSHLGRAMPFADRHLDMVIATHPDADHISGLPGVFKRYTVDQLLVSELEDSGSAIYTTLLTAAETQNTSLYRPIAGEIISFADGVQLEIVHPQAEPLPDGRNDNSISLRLVYGDFTLLLTGDAEIAGEQAMLTAGHPLQSLIFKAGHHGANNASTTPFLATVQPQIIVVSAGADNKFGHPHPDVLARAAEIGATVLRTDQLGSLSIQTDGHTMWWTAQKSNS